MKAWRAANLERQKLPAGTVLHGVPELVSMFASNRYKVDQAARVVSSDLERLEERTRAEKKELEAARRAEQEQLCASLQEKDASHTADVEHLETLHLEEMKLKDAALKEKEDALIQKQAQLAKALDTTADLQDKVARLTQASKVQELEALEGAHGTDSHFNRLFPKTRDAADTTVEVSREERRAAGQEVDVTSGWSVEEIGVGLRALLRVLGESVARLQIAGSSMVKALWPEGVEQASMSRLSRWLAAGEDRLDAWRASIARAGAYMALRLAKSWYRNRDLGKLVAQRDGSVGELQAMEEELRVRASGIASYAAWDELNLERGEGGNVIPEDLHGLQPYDADGSSDEAAHEVENVAASSGEAYAYSDTDGAGSPRGGDGATALGAADDGEATTSRAAPEATDEAAAP
ncbi:hypothetical protein ZWY2020_022424 [Hordeum vulgare]|nr:hypothetical protein ZWY2020_022424 [Hordeum vulgare]